MTAGGRRTAIAATLVVGAALLWGTFHTTRGSATFWVVGFALAAVWVLGGVVAREAALPAVGRVDLRACTVALALGVASFVAFYVAYRVLRDVALFDGALDDVVVTAGSAHVGALVALTVVNGVAEEVFFRGALWSEVEVQFDDDDDDDDSVRAVVVTTAAYALVTAASLNVALVVAAAVMGAEWAMVRRWSGGFAAPALCHVTWSTAMLVALQ